ncbi:phosphopantetheine-binding protein [Haloferula helveola]
MTAECATEDVIRMLEEEQLLELPAGADGETDLFEAGLDSMAVMQLIVVIEERWGAVLGAADVGRDTIGTPARMAATINARR